MKYLKIKKFQKNWILISLDRALKKNALNQELVQNFRFFLKEIKLEKIRGLVITGEGKDFCAGADLSSFLLTKNQKVNKSLKELFLLFQDIEQLEIPVLAHVQGRVYGGGLGFLSVCDFVSAEPRSSFCFSELNLGLIPSIVSVFLEKKHIYLHTKMLEARPFGVKKALNSNLIHFSGKKLECEKWRKSLIKHLNSFDLKAFKEAKLYLKKEKKLNPLKTLEGRIKDSQKQIKKFLNK